MRYVLLLAAFTAFLLACQPVLPATQMPEGITIEEPAVADESLSAQMPPTVSAEPGAEPPFQPIKFQPSGKVLVDGITKYIEYNVADFEKAKSEGRIVFIEFSAVWCPFCQRLDPIIRASIANLNDPDVVGFKADYDDDVALKREYNVIYQHTRLIITPDGQATWKSLDTEWNDELFRYELKKAKGE